MINVSINQDTVHVEIPLTNRKNHIRIKKRNRIGIGELISTKKELNRKSYYIEWQIRYYYKTTKEENKIIYNEKCSKTGKITYYCLNELSEILRLCKKINLISEYDIAKLIEYTQEKSSCKFIEQALYIDKCCLTPVFNSYQLKFVRTFIRYPVLTYECNTPNHIFEIVKKEMQKGFGTQAMFYYSFPITALKVHDSFFDRPVKKNETAIFEINKNNVSIFIDMVKIFAILNNKHNEEMLRILEYISKNE